MSLFFIPSAMLAYETLPRHLMEGATGLFALTRTIGASIGIAVIGLMLTRRSEYHWQVLSQHVTPHSPTVQAWLSARGMTLDDPGAGATIVGTVMRPAQFLAFGDVFIFVTLVVILLALLVVFLRRTKRVETPPAPAE